MPSARSDNTRSALLVVVVMYERAVSESAACVSLLDQANDGSWTVLVYDNSPTLRDHPPGRYISVHDRSNGGVAAAYNRALLEAAARGCAWLLLLDQDTELPPHFIQDLLVKISTLQSDGRIAAIVPRVEMKGSKLSPVYPGMFGGRPYQQKCGAESRWLMAINSGTAVRVDFMRSIGGFSNEFWLDYLDHWLFRKICECKAQVYVNDIVIEHDLSIHDVGRSMTPSRYKNYLAAERLFTNRYLPQTWRPVLCMRLWARGIRHLIFTPDKEFCRMTLISGWQQLLSVIGIR